MLDEEEEERKLRAIFERYEKNLMKAAETLQKSKNSAKSYIKAFYKAVAKEVQEFKKEARQFVDKDIEKITMKPSSMALIKAAGAKYETANVKQTTYVQIVTSLAGAAKTFKDDINDYIKQAEKEGDVRTVGDIQEFLTERLKSGNATAVEYSNGARMPAEKYSAMLARTTRIETSNIAMLGKALDDENDLVECPYEGSTCPICAVYQNRIYSITGKTKGYPALYETAFKNGYSIIHPNCRHQFFPYNPKFHTAKEREQLEEATRRSFKPDTEDRHFQQSKTVAEEYGRTQSLMRKWNEEINKYSEYKLYCEEKGITPKYTTLGGFRRAYRANKDTEAYKNSHYWRKS